MGNLIKILIHLKFTKMTIMSVKSDAGSIVFKKDKKEVFVLNAPYLVDKDGNRNQEVGYDYKELDNGNIKVTLSLTTSWLSEEDRVYPVVARSNVAVEKCGCY